MRLYAVVDSRSGDVAEWWETREQAAIAVDELVSENGETEGALSIAEIDLPDTAAVRYERPGRFWLQGTVVSEGAPVAGASIRSIGRGRAFTGTEIYCGTGRDGRFVDLNACGPGRYRVEVRVRGVLRAAEEVVVGPTGANVTIRLQPGKLSPDWLP